MRKHLVLLLLALSSMLTAGELKMMVFSDPHVLHQSLIGEKDFSGAAYLVEYSQSLFDEALRLVVDSMPDVLLIPGDLTYNGDSVSHRYVATALSQLSAMGIQVVVIPGNHDINEPGAYSSSYSGVVTGPVTVSQFRELYAACGYAAAEEIFTDSLSYMIYLDDRTALVCMNSSMDNTAAHQSAGGITEEVLAWAEQAAAKAIDSGRYPIGVTHHQLVQHFLNQQMMDADHIANSNEEVLSEPALSDVECRLAGAGITSVFTGHMHIESVKSYQTGTYSAGQGRVLYDISTNALCGYGAAIRTIVLQDGEFAQLSARGLGDIEGLTVEERQEKALARNTNMTNMLFNKVTSMVADKIGSSSLSETFKTLMATYMKQDYTQLFCYLTAGDEYSDPDAAKAHAQRCMSDYSSLCSALKIAARLIPGIDTNALNSYLSMGDALLSGTVYSIMYNMVSENRYDPSIRNLIHDSDPVIPTQYEVPHISTALENTYSYPSHEGVYTIDGRFLGTKERLTDLPQGVYVVDGRKCIK